MAPIVTEPAVEYLYVLGVLFVGFLVYIPFVYYKCSLGFMGNYLIIDWFYFLKITIVILYYERNRADYQVHSVNVERGSNAKADVRLKSIGLYLMYSFISLSI